MDEYLNTTENYGILQLSHAFTSEKTGYQQMLHANPYTLVAYMYETPHKW